MAETAVAMAPVTGTVAPQKPLTEPLNWTAMIWAELLAFVSPHNELNDDPLLDRW